MVSGLQGLTAVGPSKVRAPGDGDPAGYDRTPRAVRDAAHEQDAKLRAEGALMHGVVEVWPLKELLRSNNVAQ